MESNDQYVSTPRADAARPVLHFTGRADLIRSANVLQSMDCAFGRLTKLDLTRFDALVKALFAAGEMNDR